jgi:hypothetical protein
VKHRRRHFFSTPPSDFSMSLSDFVPRASLFVSRASDFQMTSSKKVADPDTLNVALHVQSAALRRKSVAVVVFHVAPGRLRHGVWLLSMPSLSKQTQRSICAPGV